MVGGLGGAEGRDLEQMALGETRSRLHCGGVIRLQGGDYELKMEGSARPPR